ncbi:anti-sigma factor domain-containing protein [Pseudalkalibacillus berkeleyi]|uniref:Anti-sigma factor domain-containing protein n=1 Tax=Pseudalkalibacillus berkeleyi TaxID=1069813 RepID=A0ABS9H0P7_9BACL|nr:anti-sigma factor domain-containing protein [Pseudalkalibacillus berkeleyi]MCF6138574.1 anti-sigma factor domain-containing protein [Pseudalkalibacillus berkeleyi]
MKRGLIMKVSKRKAVILTKDGSFENVRLKKGEQPEIGQEYICPNENVHPTYRTDRMLLPSFSLSLVAIIVFVLVAGGFPFGHQKASAAAYVSFDINPSIEVAVDKDLNVLKVRALNEDAKSLLDNTEGLENKSLKHFSQSLFKKLKEFGYFDTYNDLLITSSYDQSLESSDVQKRIKDAINQLKSNKQVKNTSIVLSIMETTPEQRKEANKLGLSMGKFMVYQDALQQDQSLKVEHVRTLSFSELRKLNVDKNNTDVVEAVLPEGSTPQSDQVKHTNFDSKETKPLHKKQDSQKNTQTKSVENVLNEPDQAELDTAIKDLKEDKVTAPSVPAKTEDSKQQTITGNEENKDAKESENDQDAESEEDDEERKNKEEENEGKDISKKHSHKKSFSKKDKHKKDHKNHNRQVKIKIHLGEWKKQLPSSDHNQDRDLLKVQFVQTGTFQNLFSTGF